MAGAAARSWRARAWLATDGRKLTRAWRRWQPMARARSRTARRWPSCSTPRARPRTPKGVMVTPRQPAAQRGDDPGRRSVSRERSVIVGWLPLYHDMGLIGNVLQPLYVGAPCVLMSPVAFLQRPVRWLEAISRYRATTSGGPNFAYELCVRKVAASGARGPRPVAAGRWPSTAPSRCGPRRWSASPTAFAPVRLPARGVLSLLRPGRGDAVRLRRHAGVGPGGGSLRSSALERDRVAARRGGESRSARLVGCGRAWAGQEVAIVDPETAPPLPADRVGEIWVAGPSVAQGYWNRPEETARTFGARLAADRASGPFLRTGDLGFLRGGELFVTGRLKDLIILRGRNHYPQDLELTAERSHPALRPGLRRRLLGRGGRRGAAGGACRRSTRRREVGSRREAADGDPPGGGRGARGAGLARVVLVRAGRRAQDLERQDPAPRLPRSCSWPAVGAARRVARGRGGAAGRGACRASRAADARRGARWRRIWEEVLGLAPRTVGVGRQLLRARRRLAARQRSSSRGSGTPTGRGGLTLDELFAAPTLADLAAALWSRGSGPAPAGSLALEPAWSRHRQPLPLSLAAAPALVPAPARAGQPGLQPRRRRSRLHRGASTRPRSRAALAEIVRRHEALRTVFRGARRTRRRRSCSPPASVAARALPAGCSADAEPLRGAAELDGAGAAALRPGARPAPARRLVRLGPDEHELLVAVHHIVADGWSLGVLLRELAALYEAFAAGRPSPLPPSCRCSTRDFAVWQRAPAGRRALGGDRLAVLAASGSAASCRSWSCRRPAAPAGAELPRRPCRATCCPRPWRAACEALARPRGATPLHGPRSPASRRSSTATPGRTT